MQQNNMAARRKSYSGSEHEDRLRPSVSAGSVHGDVVQRRGSRTLPTQGGFLAYLGGFSAGLTCSCVLFLLTLWLPLLTRQVSSYSGQVVVALPPSHKFGSINQVHAKWLTEVSTTLSVQMPLHYLVALQSTKEMQSVCNTWGKYIPKEQITVFTASSEGPSHLQSCANSVFMADARMTALTMVQHVCNKPTLLESTKWFFLVNASLNYPVVRNLERFVFTLDPSTLSYIGQPVAYSTGHRICVGDKGMLLSSRAVNSICSALVMCTDVFSGGTGESFIALGLCLHDSAHISCQPSGRHYIAGSEVIKSPPMTTLPDDTLAIHHPEPIDDASYLVFHLKALWLELDNLNTIEEYSIADLTILKEKMPQLEYMIRLSSSASTRPHSLPDNEVVGWDLIDFDSVYSEYLSEPVKPLHGTALVDIDQIKRKVNDFMQHITLSDRHVQNMRVDTVHRHLDVKTGVEYVVTVDVTVSSKDSTDTLTEPRKRRYQVHVERPLQLSQYTGTLASDDAHSKAPVHLLLFLDGKDAEGELTSFLTKNAQLLKTHESVPITVASPTPTQKVSLQNISARFLQHKQVLFLEVHSLPVVERLAAFVRKMNLSSILLATSWKMTLPLHLVHRCQSLSVEGHQIYMPIPFTILNNSQAKNDPESAGFWSPDQHEVFCGWLQDMKGIFMSVAKIPHHFTMTDFFHELLYKGIHIVRMTDGGLHSVANGNTVIARQQRKSHLISKLLNN